jgi:hypothetical protein
VKKELKILKKFTLIKSAENKSLNFVEVLLSGATMP